MPCGLGGGSGRSGGRLAVEWYQMVSDFLAAALPLSSIVRSGLALANIDAGGVPRTRISNDQGSRHSLWGIGNSRGSWGQLHPAPMRRVHIAFIGVRSRHGEYTAAGKDISIIVDPVSPGVIVVCFYNSYQTRSSTSPLFSFPPSHRYVFNSALK